MIFKAKTLSWKRNNKIKHNRVRQQAAQWMKEEETGNEKRIQKINSNLRVLLLHCFCAFLHASLGSFQANAQQTLSVASGMAGHFRDSSIKPICLKNVLAYAYKHTHTQYCSHTLISLHNAGSI